MLFIVLLIAAFVFVGQVNIYIILDPPLVFKNWFIFFSFYSLR